jgi:hypothetical protein
LTGALVVIFALAVLLRGLVLLLPEWRLEQIASDDMFYYVEAGRRTVETGGWPSMDGVHRTSGFHPLYILLAIGANAVAPVVGVSAVRVLMAINLALSLLIAVCLAKIVLRAAGPRAHERPWLFFALFGLDFTLVGHATVGVENMLSAAVVLWVAARFLARHDAGAPWTTRAALADGAILGLAGLCRTDNVLVAVGLGLAALVLAPRAERRRTLARLALAGAVALAVVSPWLIALAVQQGTIVQDSARAIVVRTAHHASLGTTALATEVGKNLVFWIYRLSHAWVGIPITACLLAAALRGGRARRVRMWSAGRALGVACAATGIAMLAIRANSVWDLRSPIELGLEILLLVTFVGLGHAISAGGVPVPRAWAVTLGTPVVLLLAYYALLFRHFQLWYTTSSVVLLLLVIGRALVGLIDRGELSRATQNLLVATALVGSALLSYRVQVTGTYGPCRKPDPDPAEVQRRLATVLPAPPPRVGSFDSGLLSYHLHPYPIVNLDGVANHDAATALQSGTYAEWLQQAGVEYAISSPARMAFFAAIGMIEYEVDTAMSEQLGLQVFRLKTQPEAR